MARAKSLEETEKEIVVAALAETDYGGGDIN
jgi:hypothetical protein